MLRYSPSTLAAASALLCLMGQPTSAQVQQVEQPEPATEAGETLQTGVRSEPVPEPTPEEGEAEMRAAEEARGAPPEEAAEEEPAPDAGPEMEPMAFAPAAVDAGRRPAPPASGREIDPGVELDMVMLRSQIWNPNTGRFDEVEHRGYVDRRRPPPEGNLYQAPLVEARPGETVRVNFRNLLPAEPDCDHSREVMNDPDQKQCYNDTNNHFHGGWVNPDGISDNVLRVLKPNPDHLYEYEYNIPQEHAAGTFWYHPHVHGSTAIQVGSGMAGPIIIRGDRWPEALSGGGYARGDIDVLLKDPDGALIPDKVFLLQQIQYACGQDEEGENIWNCPEGEVGRLDSYRLFLNPGPQWDRSGRFTTVNGRVAAPLAEEAVVGQPERWRFIHAGISDTIRVQIFRRNEPETLVAGESALFERTAAADQDEVIREACAIDEGTIAMFEIATDGLTRPSLLEATERFLQPGYRSDVLVAFEEPGEYCVIDAAAAPGQGIPGSLETRRLLFTVAVNPAESEPDDPAPPSRDAILEMMQAAAEAGPLEPDLKAEVIAALAEGDLGFFAPFSSLAGEEIDNVQSMRFSLGGGLQSDAPTVPPGPGIGYRRTAPDQPVAPFGVLRYSANPLDTVILTLGDVDEWRLTSADAPHPFHIHVNPFEIIAVNKQVTVDGVETTRDLTVEPDVDNEGNEIPTEYLGMKGAFKDTIILAPGAEVVVRSKYERYIGSFVLHCHILYHEDLGMMRNVRIIDPGHVDFTSIGEVAQEH